MKLVQVGITAMRTLDGKHLPSAPMFMYVDFVQKNGLTDFENQSCTNICGFFATKRKEKQWQPRARKTDDEYAK